jgi:hypothetical protein
MRLLGSNIWLLFSAVGDLLVAALHVVIVFVGSPAYLYFGATSLAVAAQRGESWPALFTSAIAIVSAGWGWYALAGAGLLSRPPLIRTVLVAVAALYSLRGLVVIPDLLRLLAGVGYPLRQTAFSACALGLGIMHWLGTIHLFRRDSVLSSKSA